MIWSAASGWCAGVGSHGETGHLGVGSETHTATGGTGNLDVGSGVGGVSGGAGVQWGPPLERCPAGGAGREWRESSTQIGSLNSTEGDGLGQGVEGRTLDPHPAAEQGQAAKYKVSCIGWKTEAEAAVEQAMGAILVCIG